MQLTAVAGVGKIESLISHFFFVRAALLSQKPELPKYP